MALEGGARPLVQNLLGGGPLSQLNRFRNKIVAQAMTRSFRELSSENLDLLLGEALYQERDRMRRVKKRNLPYLFNYQRHKGDRLLWKKVLSGIRKNPIESDRNLLLKEVLYHYGHEIAGKFDEKVYRFATQAVPWGMNWLLHAASVKRFLPWGMKEQLLQSLRVEGEIPHVQKLAQKGTVLLVPTHQSNIDSLLVGYVIYLMGLPPFSYGAGLNLFTNPVLGYFMSHLGAYTVDRQKSNLIYKSILKNYSTVLLKRGVHSVFFPGGGRSRSGAIESRLKLGLLGTGLAAETENLRRGKPNPRVYVVPMISSYHFVLEAASLIEDYLASQGRHRFMPDTEPFEPFRATKFLWRLFSSQTSLSVRIGKPLDIFGNFVDEEGQSIGPNGTTIDPKAWLTTQGELRPEPERDQEYVRRLGRRLVDRYYRENVVLSSHLLAFTYFMVLREKYPDLDLYRFLRLSLAQRSLPYDRFLERAEGFHQKLKKAADRGELQLSDELKTSDVHAWIEDGLRHLGVFHDANVVKVQNGVIWTEDLSLLYYYRNRLSGYGFSLLGDPIRAKGVRGEEDELGFLA